MSGHGTIGMDPAYLAWSRRRTVASLGAVPKERAASGSKPAARASFEVAWEEPSSLAYVGTVDLAAPSGPAVGTAVKGLWVTGALQDYASASRAPPQGPVGTVAVLEGDAHVALVLLVGAAGSRQVTPRCSEPLRRPALAVLRGLAVQRLDCRTVIRPTRSTVYEEKLPLQAYKAVVALVKAKAPVAPPCEVGAALLPRTPAATNLAEPLRGREIVGHCIRRRLP